MTLGGRNVVDHVNLTAPRGAVTVVLGPNGAGKTTTIEVAEGFRAPHSGQVRVLGLDPVRDAAELRSRVGVMLQSGGVWPAVTPKVLLRHLSRLYSNPQPVPSLLAALELTHVAGTPYRRLSGGEAHKLELAAAIIGRPELVFLDEPTTGLDPHSRLRIWGLISDLRDAGVSVLMTTHLLDEAENLADAVTIMSAGRIVASGTVDELTQQASAGAVLSFSARPGLNLADLAMRLPASLVAAEVRPGSYQVSGPIDPHVAALVTAWCASQGAMPEGLTTAGTLTDAYFRLVAGAEEQVANG
jgi:ABC-2 type transport system ATP-binding protein